MKTKPFFLIRFAMFLGLIGISCINVKAIDVVIKQIDSQKALVLKADIPIAQISQKMGEMYGRLFDYLGEKNIQPTGAPFAVYYAFDPKGNVVFEAGVPIAANVEVKEDMVIKEFPAMKAATCLYKGAYEKMEPVYNELNKYIQDNQLKQTGISWEVYLTDPSTLKDPNENQTLIYFPVE
jgi:effector-binding domain-containing protein